MTPAVANEIAETRPNRASLPIAGADSVQRIRAWLIASGYAESAAQSLRGRSAADAALLAAGPEPPEIRLLLHGQALSLSEAEAVFAPGELSALIDSRLLEIKDGQLCPLARIAPHRNLFIVSDCHWTSEARLHPDTVMGVTSSSDWLASLTIRRRAECALDLGTGTGIQALLAARHSKHVVATDINPRALEFARFNAALNGVDNIEFIEADLFDEFGDRTFDLIVCNPPFTVSPASTCLYRDNPMNADGLVEKIVQTVPQHLAEGAYAHVVGNWVQKADEIWTTRITRWLKDSGCDSWVMRDQSLRPESYARIWLADYDTPNADALFKDWMSYYDREGITAIDSGLFTMRRVARRPNWLRFSATAPRFFPDAGRHVAHCFALQDVLDSLRGMELLNAVLRISPSVEFTEKSKPSSMGWRPQSCRFAMTRGIAYTVDLDPALARLVVACDGRRRLGRLMEARADDTGIRLDVFVRRHLDTIRRLVTLGFLWPVRHRPEPRSAAPIPERLWSIEKRLLLRE